MGGNPDLNANILVVFKVQISLHRNFYHLQAYSFVLEKRFEILLLMNIIQ